MQTNINYRLPLGTFLTIVLLLSGCHRPCGTHAGAINDTGRECAISVFSGTLQVSFGMYRALFWHTDGVCSGSARAHSSGFGARMHIRKAYVHLYRPFVDSRLSLVVIDSGTGIGWKGIFQVLRPGVFINSRVVVPLLFTLR